MFVTLGIYQILRGQLFGSASSLFFYALVMRQMAALDQARARGFATRMAKPAGGAAAIGSGSNAPSLPSPACGGG